MGRADGDGLAWRAGVVLLAVSLLAFFIRTAHYTRLPAGERTAIINNDAQYHLRVARLIEHDYPRVPSFDPYLNFPLGADIPWPFLQDFVAATLAKISPWKGSLETICFFYPAVAASLAVFLVFLLARGLGLGTWSSVAAAALSSLVMQHVSYTNAGYYDHHAGDYFYLLLFLCSVLWTWRERERPLLSLRVLAAQGVLAVSGALLLLNFLGAVVYPGILLLAGAAAALDPRRDRSCPAFLGRAGASVAAGGVLLAFSFLLAYGPSRLAALAVDKPTGLHPLLLGGVGLVLGLAALAAARGREALRDPRFWVLGVLLLGVVAVAAGTVIEGFVFYLTRRDPMVAIVGEYAPSFSIPDPSEEGLLFSFKAGVGGLSWAVFLFPVFLFLAWRRGMGKDRTRGFPLYLFLTLSTVFLILALAQRRWANVYAVPCGIGSAWILSLLLRWLRDRGLSPSRRWGAGIAALAVVLSFHPILNWLAFQWRYPGGNLGVRGYARTMDWLATHTPPPSDPFRLDQRPAYGVLSFWELGHGIVALGRRPVIATPFLGTLPGDLFRQSKEFFLERDPEKAWEFMMRNRLRYLLLPEVAAPLDDAIITLERDRRRELWTRPPLAVTLWGSYGSAYSLEGGVVGGCRHFRLLWEDRFPGRAVGSEGGFKVFEAVRGAVLRGKAPPGGMVITVLRLAGRINREISWFEVAVAGASGDYFMTVPYPTDRASGTTSPVGPYEIEVPGRQDPIRVTVTETDVVEGRTVEVR